MAQTGSHDVFGVLAALLAAQLPAPAGDSPVERVVERIERSISLAVQSGLRDASVHLDRQDFAWLCNAMGIDRLSMARFRMKVSGLVVHRSSGEGASHVRGLWGGRPAALAVCPDLSRASDPGHLIDAGDAQKHLQTKQILVLEQMDPHATRQ
jgi:hypothetical protein